ncbi:STAS domain-containing protein [Streptomyces rubiginosohelvolus]|uniref:STAS domain-containing protein n=1 Tax=Streptomyces rubiginosohelvolus TaxID=67362 RepID=UPI0036DE13B0
MRVSVHRWESWQQVFSVQIRPASDAAVLQLRGELDVESVVQLDEAAHTALSAQPPPHLVVVDCAFLSFCDSSGIGGFVRLYQRLAAQQGQLRLAAPPAAVARVFSLTGLDGVIAVHTSTEDALAESCDGPDRVVDTRSGTCVGERGVA